MPSRRRKREGERSARIHVRTMSIDDFPSVFHLGEDLFTSEEAPVLYRTWDEWEITNYFSMDPRYCIVAADEETNEVLGFALGSTVEKSRSSWKYGYLAWIGVRPDVQRRRIGKRLYEAMERRMAEDGVRIMMLDTDEENRAAQAFFQRVAFKETAWHVWMAKRLRRAGKARARTQAERAPGVGGLSMGRNVVQTPLPPVEPPEGE